MFFVVKDGVPMRTLTAVLLSATGLATAQTAEGPRFEVASVRPAATDEGGAPRTQHGDDASDNGSAAFTLLQLMMAPALNG